MKVVLKSVEQFDAKLVERTRHIVHGNVILPGAVKMSSRRGNFLRAIEVLDMVSEEEKRVHTVEKAMELQKRRMAAMRMMMAKLIRNVFLRSGGLGRKQKLLVMKAVVEGATRYAFLKSKIGPENIVFNVKESVNLHGNSGPYLQYALVRAKAILRRAHNSADSIRAERSLDRFERGLLLKILGWREAVRGAVEELQPQKVCGYLYELAQEFSRFYEHDKVVGGENEKLRVELVRKYAEVLEAGLKLLGVPVVERM